MNLVYKLTQAGRPDMARRKPPKKKPYADENFSQPGSTSAHISSAKSAIMYITSPISIRFMTDQCVHNRPKDPKKQKKNDRKRGGEGGS